MEPLNQHSAPHPILAKDPWLRMAERASSGSLWDWDLRSGTILCSEFCSKYYEFPQSATYDHATWHSRIHPEDRDAFHAGLAVAHQQQQPILRSEFRAPTRSGDMRWVCSHAEIHYDNGLPIRMCGIDIDVTQHHRALESLRRSERLVLAGQIAATVAHEINNPLEAVGNLVYLANLEQSQDQIHRYLGHAEEELARIHAIARQTLGFYREDLTPSSFGFSEICELTVRVLQRRAEQKGVRVSLDLAPQLRMRGNRGEILQVFINLVANAIDAVSVGGAVRVRADRAGNRLRIAVLDDGSGIPRNHRACIFQPFFTSKGALGTGLGLWVSRSIVERHHGTIRFRSSTAPGRSGTLFLVSFPDAVQAVNAA